MSVASRRSSVHALTFDIDLEKLRAMRKNKFFRRIEADIRERDRKRKPGRPEQYVDRDRIIAVSIGETDIRDTMLRQRMFLAKDTNMAYEEEQGFKILIQQAEHELHKGAHQRALAYLDKAVEVLEVAVPEDPMCLLLRSISHLGVQEFEKALVDINKVIEVSSCAKALLIKGDTLYHLGDFEHALVFYYRALRKRPGGKEEEALRFGIVRAQTAIENSVGPKAHRHFTEMRAIIQRLPDSVFGLTWQDLQSLGRKGKTKKKAPVKSRFARDDSKEDKESLQSKREKKYQRELLGELSKDLDYFEALATTSEATTDVRVTKVQAAAEGAVFFLKERQDFWSQFQPMYCDVRK